MKSISSFKKTTIISLLTIFLLVSLFFPHDAQAQWIVTDPATQSVLVWQTVKNIAKKLLEEAWRRGGAIAYRNGLNLFLGQMAKESAEYIASGGKGQKPMFVSDPDYWEKLGDQVLGEYIDQTAKSLTGFTGRSLCDPMDPTIKFNLLVGLDYKYQEMMFAPDMRCSWSKIRERVKEASKKKLFSFSAELKEGGAARIRAEQAAKVQGEPCFTAGEKEMILTRLKELDAHEKFVAERTEKLKKNTEGTEKFSENALTQIEKELEDKASEIKAEMTSMQDYVPLKPAKQCSRLWLANDEFCGDEKCRALTLYNPSEKDCNKNPEKYRKCVEDFIAEIKRIEDAANKLIGEIKSILNVFPDLKPSPPPTLEDLNREYNPEASDIAVAAGIKSDLFAKQAAAIEKSKFMQSLTGDINRLTGKISDTTLTPGSSIRAQWETSIKEGTAGIKEYTAVPVADAIGVFTNTLVNKLMKQLFEKGLNPSVSPEIAERTQPFNPNEPNSPTQEESKVLYADLAVASVKKGGEITIYDEFAVCPADDKKYALPTNCLLDSKLVRAIEEHLTIKEAMEKGLLQSTQLVGKSGDYTSLLSWPNVKKLRRYRIFPLGLEIAAYKISHPEIYKDIGNVETSLGTIVSGFNDPNSKFYHLVDPNWVLKASTYKCDIKSYSAIPLTGSSQRQETCVNLQDCIQENEEGQCDAWAYCTQEKNIWRFNADACDSQYASCQTYKKTKDKKQFSYLTNTLDFANCNQNNAGCKWYCSHWDKDLLQGKGNWTCVKPGISYSDSPTYTEYNKSDNAIFFNNKIEKCSAQNEGCHEYIRTAPGLGTNLIFNGSFELDDLSNWIIKQASRSNEKSKQGSYSLKVLGGENNGVEQSAQVRPGGVYTLSLDVFRPDNNGVAISIDGHSFVFTNEKLNAWTRISETFTASSPNIKLYLYNHSGDPAYFDNLKLETGKTSSPYKDYGEVNKIYFKNALECQPGEVGCELYVPTNGDPAIQGIVEEKDKCGFDCLGYETFQEMSSNFDFDTRVVNLIPSTAKTCAVPGCEEFTNLDTERVEYYSYLRQCVKVDSQGQAVMNNDGTSINPPSENLCKKYYTWVGSETAGYQLKKYFLKKADQQYAGDPDAGGPMNFTSNPNLDWGDCEDKDDALVNPHCKQFYAADGKIYYRLYKNTVSCAQDCVSYRRSIDQSIKTAVVSESEACSKQDKDCREYKGSAGDNIIKIFSDDFESAEKNSRWSSGEFSSESVNYPGTSLKVDRKISLSVDDLVFKNKPYFVSFWFFKGGTDVTVKFSSLAAQTKTGLSFNEWQEIKFGPFYFNQEPLEQEVLEISVPSGSFYIDNITIKEIQDNLYLIKGSWQTPCSCDTLANHDFYSTGAKSCTIGNTSAESMVGCQVYQGRDKQSYYLKSFTNLCSESAVGCEALIDTQNSDWPKEKTFNDIIIPADKIVYLVNDAKNKCESKYEGCQKFGQPELDIDGNVISHTDVYLINNPDLYVKSPILCLKEDVGCEEYQGPVYFKDPGEKLCEYRENIQVNANELKTGWFKTGTNYPCYYNDDGSPYQINGVVYGIRFSDDPKYRGWAGSCPMDQSSCTEFIDPIDVKVCQGNSDCASKQCIGYKCQYGTCSTNADCNYAPDERCIAGKCREYKKDKGLYYYLNNNKLDKSSCQGMVGLKDGCILFNNTSQSSSSLLYNSEDTYLASKNKNDLSVPAITTSENKRDANIILKVKRDRVCGEWLDCSGWREVWDNSLGEYRKVCDVINRCDKLVGYGENKICGNWVFYSTPQPLTESLYTSRNVSWSGMDYSGHSIFNMYPIETLYTTETPKASGIYKLTYINKQGKEKGVDGKGKIIEKTCQIFPEKDSPFPKNSGTEAAPKNDYYNDVNVCSKKEGGIYPDCQCSYKKVEYSGITRYYDYKSSSIPNGICASGSNVGKDCKKDTDCGDAGSCSAKSKETIALGLRGFCLEKDESKPAEINACLTWWPGPGVGDPDIFEHYPEAGYQALGGKQWYCYGSIGTGPHFPVSVSETGIKFCPSSTPNCASPKIDDCQHNIDSSVQKKWIVKEIPDIRMSEVKEITVYLKVDSKNDKNCTWNWDAQATKELNAGNNWWNWVYNGGSGSKPEFDNTSCGGYKRCIKIKACFNNCSRTADCDDCANDNNDYVLHHFSTKAIDDVDPGGTSSAKFEQIKIYLKNGCKYMVKIPDPTDGVVKGAYTDRLWPESAYYKNASNNASKKCEPYGAYSESDLDIERLVLAGDGLESCNKAHTPFLHTTETSLRNLFAFILDYPRGNKMEFDIGAMLYDYPKTEWKWDALGSGPAPTIASVDVGTCDENNVCKAKEGGNGKITINNQDSGKIGGLKSYSVVLKFFAWADTNHMPIKKIFIDWKDGRFGDYTVVAKNHKPEGGCDNFVNPEFGKSADACVEKYFQFNYIYYCEGPKSAGWNNALKACVFTPTVTVTDNWDTESSGVYGGTIGGTIEVAP